MLTLPVTELPLSPEMELRLTEKVTLAGIEHAADRFLLLHAAGLSRTDGSVLGLVAASGTGKTTAAMHLARSGFGYVTDETLAVAADLTVRAWPKPLALVDADGGPKTLHGPDELGLASCPDELRLARLVVLERDPRVPTPRLQRLADAEAVSALVGQSSSLGRLEAPLLRLERLLGGIGGLYRLEYAEILDATALLAELLATSSAPAPVTGPRVFAAPVRDALAVDEGVAVLLGDRVVHLAGVGAEVWLAAHGGATFVSLEEAVTSRLGPHPEAARLVADAVDDLVAHGVLRVEPG